MSTSSPQHAKGRLSNASYDRLKAFATIILPAVGALYFTLAQIWHLSHAEEVVGSIAALNTFVGVVVGLSTKSYNKSKFGGVIQVSSPPNGAKKIFSLDLASDPEDLEHMDEITFRVVGPSVEK